MGATTHDTEVSLHAAENAYFKAGQGAGGENTWNYLLTTPFKARHKLAAAEFSSCQHVIEVSGRRSLLVKLQRSSQPGIVMARIALTTSPFEHLAPAYYMLLYLYCT